MKRILIVFGFLVLLMGVCAWSQTSPQKAGNALIELGDLLVGRWMGEVTWAFDYPGGGRKGEQVLQYSVATWTADKAAIETNSFAGKTTAKYLLGWDAASKEIRGFVVDSSGSLSQVTITKQAGKWVYSLVGSFVDGRRFENKGGWTFLDNGNAYVEEGTIIVGKEKNDYRATYKRLSK